ncbi:MAG: DUF5615 family PIN-like protein [Caulobacteraceae bacterium]|nr:DUF5615 family PIN-like protein [Caulobacteraceae bacterium]
MRFLADECCPRQVIEAVEGLGHDLRRAVVTHATAPDLALAELAADDDRIILTEDYDFGEIVVRLGVKVPGVLIIGYGDRDPDERARLTADLIVGMGEGLLGHLTILDRRRTPRRRSI